MNKLIFLACISTLTMACKTNQASQSMPNKTLFVESNQVDCIGVGEQKCLQIREQADQPWQLFYDNIAGFTYEPGYEYELEVSVEPVKNAPADASNLKYTLVKQISKAKVSNKENPIQGEWMVVQLNGKEYQGMDNSSATISFDFEEDKVNGNSGCNSFFGKLTTSENENNISFGAIGATRRYCAEVNETEFFSALDQVKHFKKKDSQLELLDADNEVVLLLSRP